MDSEEGGLLGPGSSLKLPRGSVVWTEHRGMGRNWGSKCAPQQGSHRATRRMRAPPELKTYCLVKRGQEKGTCAYTGQKNYPWREGIKRDPYFTVYFLTLLKLMQEWTHLLLMELKKYKW